jgi:LacI family transcriptional regulator, galactose operon repressor
MPASIEDVAKLANVSISTVSRVVNRRALVNEETCKRVEAAIRQLHYRPNAFARGLMLRKSGIVGLVLPDLHGEFYSEIIRGANSKAREMGHNLLVSSALPGDDAESWVSIIGQHALVDGLALMVSDTMVTGIGHSLGQLHVPLIVLDDEIEGVEHDAVIIDQRQGALAMMRHLLDDCSAQRVIFVGGVETNIDTQARYKAYRDSLRKSGITFQKSDVYHLDYTYESAYRLALEKVEEWVGPHHIVFAANDEMAAGIIAGAITKNYRVPRDLGVVGFDDTRVAQMTNPLLTTVHVPMSRMGATAIELLCERIAEPTRPPTKIALEAELVVRDSCGCAAKKTK